MDGSHFPLSNLRYLKWKYGTACNLVFEDTKGMHIKWACASSEKCTASTEISPISVRVTHDGLQQLEQALHLPLLSAQH